MSEHLPRHVMERLVDDDARDVIPLGARAHLASCRACSARVQSIERARSEFIAAHPPDLFAAAVLSRAAVAVPAAEVASARPVRPAQWLRLRWPATVALASALLLLWVWPRSEPAVRYKGAPVALEIYVRSGSSQRPLRSGDALRARDQLAFAYALDRPQHLLLLGIDDAGTVTRYYPERDTPVHPLAAGSLRQLPVGIELDARRGQERLVALFSARPLDASQAREALAQALREAHERGAGIADMHELSLPGSRTRQVSIWFEKP